MSKTVLKVESLSKVYRLGEVGTGTISSDINRWWAKVRGKEDPFSKVGQINDRSMESKSDFVYALKDVDFEVQEGEVMGIIGQNGAGKSTLLKLISKITAPTHGSIKAKGRIASLLEVGTGMHPEMTARENVYLNGAILGMKKWEIAKKFEEIIEFAGCKMYVDTPVKRFSSGMRVRLGFAVAAFLEPEILIVDEVLAVGDAEFQKKAIGKMKDVSSEQGRTVLFVSHNMASVENLCTKSIVLDKGKIDFKGGAKEGVNHYLMKSIENSNIPVGKREDRVGNGKVKITGISLENGEGEEINHLQTGKNCVLRFDYKKQNNQPYDRLVFIVQLKNEKDEPITYLASDETGDLIELKKDSGAISICFDKLQLREGNYIINFRLSEKKTLTSPHINIDYLQNAFSFKVETGDYWKSGFLNRPGGFIPEFKFESE